MSRKSNLPQWNFFRILEEDLEECFGFVEPLPEHHNVHSDQFAAIILLACTEIENALMYFCSKNGCKPKPENIEGYRRCILQKYPNLTQMSISIPRYNIKNIKPLSDLTDKSSPDFWRNGYNNIKHNRLNNPKAPTLLRAINALGGLFIILLHNYRAIENISSISIDNMPILFEVDSLNSFDDESVISWSWQLPDDDK